MCVVNRKYKVLLSFEIGFALVNTILILCCSFGDYKSELELVLSLLFVDALISIAYGYITYTKLNTFLKPNLWFAVACFAWLFTVVLHLPAKKLPYWWLICLFVGVVYCSLSCLGALVGKIAENIKNKGSQE